MKANYKLPNHYALAWRQLHTRKDSCGSEGTGFYNGAIIGASGGFASGATASGLNEDNFGQILGNAGIGAGIGAAIGGLTAGLKAQSDGRDFWSGKQWNEITTGLGSEGATFADFEDALDWDVDKGLKLRNIPQKEGFD